ncbi:MAG: response regulator [Bacteroidota bacterium]
MCKDVTRVMVVEDDPSIRDSITDFLTLEGYDVSGNENGRQALRNIASFNPDIVISDVMMPEMNGHTLLSEYRKLENAREIPFIFLTALTNRDDFRNGMKLGADDYLTKPFTHTELLDAIDIQLKKFKHRRRKIKGELEKIVNDKLSVADREKESILMELHDRVKNNMATIAAFFELGDPKKGQEYVEKIKDRVFAMASVHEEAYSHDMLTMVSSQKMIVSIINNLLDTKVVTLSETIDEYELNIAHAIPFGLLIYEMLSYLTKDASPESASRIDISSAKSQDQVELWFRTKNLAPKDFNEPSDDSDALLISVFIGQLQGSIEYESMSEEDVRYTITFKV